MDKKQKLKIYIKLLSFGEIVFIVTLLIGPYFFFVAFMENYVNKQALLVGIVLTSLGIIGSSLSTIYKKKLIEETWKDIE